MSLRGVAGRSGIFGSFAGLAVVGVVSLTGCAGDGGQADARTSQYVDAPLPEGPVGLYAEGVLARNAGDRERAIRLLTEATSRDDRLIMANLVLGQLLAQQGDVADAEHWFRRLVERDPETASAYFALARVLEQLSRYTEAVDPYRTGLSLEPDDPAGNLGLGRTYLALGRAGDAEPYLSAATRLDADNPEAWLNLAAAYDEQQRPVDAEAAYRRAIEAAPEPTPQLLEGLAMTLIYQQTPQKGAEAVELLEQVVQQNDTPRVHERLGLAYAIAGRYNEAQEQFEQVLSQNPQDVSALNTRGTAYYLQFEAGGRLDDALRQNALQAWQASLAIDPDQPSVRSAVEAISQGSVLR